MFMYNPFWCNFKLFYNFHNQSFFYQFNNRPISYTDIKTETLNLFVRLCKMLASHGLKT